MIKENQKAWNFAMGMAAVDGGRPTPEFLELVKKEKNGEITTENIREKIILDITKGGR